MKTELTLSNRIAICAAEALAVGFAIAVFTAMWICLP